MCVYRDVLIRMYKVLLKILGDLHLRRIPCWFASIISLGLCMLCYVPRCPLEGKQDLISYGKKEKEKNFCALLFILPFRSAI